LIADEHARLALAKAERLVIRTLRPAHHKQEDRAEEDQRQQGNQDAEPVADRRRLRDVVLDSTELLR
jgi:hypothetical protein